MQISAPGKLLAALTILIVVLVITFQFLKSPAPDSSATVSSPTNSIAKSTYHFQPMPVPRPQPQELDAAGNPKIPREKVEEWLEKHNRNAMSLLAAYRALGDTNYLNEAATNFPNDPHVELAVLAKDEFPEDRRKWLDLFKNSSPSNSLANYLSAQDYFKNGNPDAAIQELQAASGKPQFDNFETESRLDEEDLYLSSGKSPLEASTESMAGISEDMLPQLMAFKQIAHGMEDLQTKYFASGDANSAINLAQMGMTLGNQLESGDSGKYIINQLVGIADEDIVLSKLDPNTSYDFLNGETPTQVMQELKDQKTAFRELSINFSAAYPLMTPDEMTMYVQRSKIYGEVPAMQWVLQQHPPPASQNSQQ